MPLVLCVDDDPAIVRMLQRTLEGPPDDIEVITAGDGRAALELLRRRSPDLVLTDLQMPFMDGFELLAHLIGRPALVITALDPTYVEARLGGSPILSVIYKPLRPLDVKRQVSEFLTRDTEGKIHGVSLAGVLQLLHLERRSCLVLVNGAWQEGWLVVDEGEVRDAQAGDLRGLDAVVELLAGEVKSVDLRRAPGGHDITVTLPLGHLLLEAARVRDEASRKGFRLLPPIEAAGAAVKSASHDSLADALSRLEGVVAAALFETATGHVVVTRAIAGADLENAAGAHAEALRAFARLAPAPGQSWEGEVIVSAGAHSHLVRTLPGEPGLAALVLVRREGANLGLVRHRLERLAAAHGSGLAPP